VWAQQVGPSTALRYVGLRYATLQLTTSGHAFLLSSPVHILLESCPVLCIWYAVCHSDPFLSRVRQPETSAQVSSDGCAAGGTYPMHSRFVASCLVRRCKIGAAQCTNHISPHPFALPVVQSFASAVVTHGLRGCSRNLRSKSRYGQRRWRGTIAGSPCPCKCTSKWLAMPREQEQAHDRASRGPHLS
jgi:hypothetical protein